SPRNPGGTLSELPNVTSVGTMPKRSQQFFTWNIEKFPQLIGHGMAFQIPAAYSAIVRSLENFPEQATLTIALRDQASGRLYNSPRRSWAWAYEVRSARCM